MANDYRILDERDIKNFQAGNKLEVTEIGNKVTYEHIGEPPNTLPSKEKVLEYGKSFEITVPSGYDSTGHVESEREYTFIMPQETNTSNFLTTDNFSSESPIHIEKDGKDVTYSHDTSGINNVTPTIKEITPDSNNTISLTALSAADDCGHATTNTKYQFQIPNTSNVPTVDNFSSKSPIHIEKDGKNIIYSHNTSGINNVTPTEEEITPDDNNIISLTVLSEADDYGHATKNTKYQFQIPNTSNVPTTGNFLSKSPIRVDTNGKDVTYSHDTSGINNVTPTIKEITPDSNNTISLTALSAADDCGHATTNTKYQFKVPSMPSEIELAGGVTGKVSDLDSKATWKLDTEVDYYHRYMKESYIRTIYDTDLKTYTTKSDISKTHFLYIVLTPPVGWNTDSSNTTPYMIPGQLTFLVPTTEARSFNMPVLLKKTGQQDIDITIDGTKYTTTIDKETITSEIRTVSFQYAENKVDPSKSSLTITSPYKFDGVEIFGF